MATAIRAFSRLEDRPHALEALHALEGGGAAAQGVRQELGDTLLNSGDYELAGLVYQQLLHLDPANANAQIGLARVAMQQFQPAQARCILQGVPLSDDVKHNFLLAKAEYHQLIGEFIEAKTIYERVLRENENDHAVRLSLGALYEQPLREDERAKAEYAKIPASAATFRLARVGLASALTNQRHFSEAVKTLKTLLAEFPSDGNAMAQLVRTLAEARRWNGGVSLGRAFLEANPKYLQAVLAVRLALGRAFLEGHQYIEATNEYEQALALPGGRTFQAYYGLARAAALSGNEEKAHGILAECAGLAGGETRNRLLLADLFDADNDDRDALDMILPVVRPDGDNLAALIRLATTQGRLARQSGKIAEAVAAAKAVLARSRTNVRGHLILARALASGQKFADSAHAYEALIRIDPTLRVPRRERARVLYSDHQFGASRAAYQELLTPPAEVPPLGAPAVAAGKPALGAAKSDFGLTGDFGSPPPDLPGNGLEGNPAQYRLFLDRQARAAEQAADRLEAEIKDRDWQHYKVIPSPKT